MMFQNSYFGEGKRNQIMKERNWRQKKSNVDLKSIYQEGNEESHPSTVREIETGGYHERLQR